MLRMWRADGLTSARGPDNHHFVALGEFFLVPFGAGDDVHAYGDGHAVEGHPELRHEFGDGLAAEFRLFVVYVDFHENYVKCVCV